VTLAVRNLIYLSINYLQYNRQLRHRPHPYETEDSANSIHGPAYSRDATDYTVVAVVAAAAAAVCDSHAAHTITAAATASMSTRHSVRAAVLAAVQMLGDDAGIDTIQYNS
jgi:hypothetical protein